MVKSEIPTLEKKREKAPREVECGEGVFPPH